jgi:hypothetical protein
MMTGAKRRSRGSGERLRRPSPTATASWGQAPKRGVGAEPYDNETA